jgi:hypothetical protein
MLDEYANALIEGVDAAVPAWVERSVERVLTAWRGSADPDVMARAAEAGRRARADVSERLRALLETDVDEQHTNPLSILRDAVHWPTEVLRDAGAPQVLRDEFSERHFPDDVYDLTPASFADVDPSLHEPGILWGAAKAKTHLDRRRGRA